MVLVAALRRLDARGAPLVALAGADRVTSGGQPLSGGAEAPLGEPGTTGVAYTYESSTTLSGAWDPFTPDSETSDSATPVEEITVDIPDALLAEPKLFIRVKAVRP